ncbi:hypothetical protein AB0O08_11900 [Streptomyces anulatus]|uniref:hypothetical protein n=1 Tax=Streptomyces anulatus TaxID=1892 RepID=UPI0034290AAD
MTTPTRLVLDQSKIRIRADLVAKGAPPFPRPLAWWQRNVPCWLAVSLDADERIVLEPNGVRADGVVREVTPMLRRRELDAARKWLRGWSALDFTDALNPAEPYTATLFDAA